MHIILVSDRLAKARSIQFSLRHFAIGLGAAAATVVLLSSLISYFGVRHASQIKLPFLQSLVRAVQVEGPLLSSAHLPAVQPRACCHSEKQKHARYPFLLHYLFSFRRGCGNKRSPG